MEADKPGIILEDGDSSFSADELTRHVNDSEFDINNLHDDGSQWDTLDAYYENALKQFGGMLSMQIPKHWIGADERETELISCKAGIAAVDVCLKKLREGDKQIILTADDPDKHESLESWYAEAFVNYMHTISLKLPEKFAEHDQKRNNLAGIKAFTAIRRELVRLLN